MRKLHEMITKERHMQKEQETIQEKLDKIELEKLIEQKRLQDSEMKKQQDKQSADTMRYREKEWKARTFKIKSDQINKIEHKKLTLEKFLEEKEAVNIYIILIHTLQHIKGKELEREQDIMFRKEDKIKSIFKTLEKNTFMAEKKKQDWLEKAL